MLWKTKKPDKLPDNPNEKVMYNEKALRKIWLAGGCFWGVEAYFARIYGVARTSVGYANGNTENPTYHDIAYTSHAETVSVEYDPDKVSLTTLLEYYFNIIDPTLKNRQGNDTGTQYRTGIYYNNPEDVTVISQTIAEEQKKHAKTIVTEVLPLAQFYPAEEYHQQYLDKNPGGYCHVDFSSLPQGEPAKTFTNEELRDRLTDIQYKVTRQNATEPPFANDYWNHHEKGIYVDIITGEPLFVSSDKFDSGCGWPSFSQPVSKEAVVETHDATHGMLRTEVRSKAGDSHLGHVFTDGPVDRGGLRYCINSAALRFVPIEEMQANGYGAYISQVK